MFRIFHILIVSMKYIIYILNNNNINFDFPFFFFFVNKSKHYCWSILVFLLTWILSKRWSLKKMERLLIFFYHNFLYFKDNKRLKNICQNIHYIIEYLLRILYYCNIKNHLSLEKENSKTVCCVGNFQYFCVLTNIQSNIFI